MSHLATQSQRTPALVGVLLFMFLSACAGPRAGGLLGINYSDQPPRVSMRIQCNGVDQVERGVGVCEQRAPSKASVSVKIPPLEGRVVYSTGQLKRTDDFNWYPKTGFWFWKKQPINDTWADLDLGDISSTFGDWPVALDVAGIGSAGVIVTRGVLYYRVCDDAAIPCSKLFVVMDCSGSHRETGPGMLAHCERMAGSSQGVRIRLKGAGYQATPGAKVYVSAPRLGPVLTYTPGPEAFSAGELVVDLGAIPPGPSLIGIRMAWIESGKTVEAETRVLITGFSPEWSGLDKPHYIIAGSTINFARPVMADELEVNLYAGRKLIHKEVTDGKLIESFQKPGAGQVACAFAWSRSSSDESSVCLNSNLEEVELP